ncbi:radical SAM protein [Candidatus Fermentibacteria bacterium]|nr:radical SAM protein [Candidatus Fermentibacteria bacterium]
MTRKQILLVYPGSNAADPGEELSSDPGRSLPMGLLFLAAALERGGFVVRLHDARCHAKEATRAWIHESLNRDVLFVGISAMTVQVAHGLAIARQVRALAPSVPIVWGGAHASLFPRGTAMDPAADFVLPREADESAVNLAAILADAGEPLEIPGVLCRKDGALVGNGEPALPDIRALPSPAYHLIDPASYAPRRIPGGRMVRGTDVLTSRGCPYRCAFCPNELLLGRRWRKRPVDQVTAELDLLLEPGTIDHVWFMDDLFIGDIDRVTSILDHLHRQYPHVRWEANVRADMFRPGFVDGAFLTYLRETGCACLRMGAESGNDEVLQLLKKDITVAETEHAVAACHDAGIVPLLFFMMGIPGETRAQLFDTLAFMARLKRRFPRSVVCGPGLFRPYPGGELYARALEAGLQEPADLAGWAAELGPQGFLRSGRLPWIADAGLMEDILFSMFYVEESDRLGEYPLPWLRKRLADLAFWRAEHRFWRLRIEARLRRLARALRGRA